MWLTFPLQYFNDICCLLFIICFCTFPIFQHVNTSICNIFYYLVIMSYASYSHSPFLLNDRILNVIHIYTFFYVYTYIYVSITHLSTVIASWPYILLSLEHKIYPLSTLLFVTLFYCSCSYAHIYFVVVITLLIHLSASKFVFN